MSINLIRPENARGVLAAGCLLGGMEDLCAYAYGACRQSISVETITEWLEFIDSIPLSPDGSLMPQSPLTSVFGEYARRLREDVFHFLVVTLPNTLEIYSSPGSESGSSQGHSGRDTLLQIFSLVPFDMFKAAVESPTFQIGACLWCGRPPRHDVLIHYYHRFRSMSLQVREGCYRAEEKGYCARAWVGGDSGACIWWRSHEWKCCSRHSKNAQTATLEGKLMSRQLLAFLAIYIT